MLSPVITVLQHFPLQFFLTILVMGIISICAYNYIEKRFHKKILTKQKGIISWVLINYLLVLLFLTVFGRRSWDYYRFNFDVGYSYFEVFSTGDWSMAIQIGVNICAFIPIGIMNCYLFKKYVFQKSVFLGISISLLIEVLQLFWKRGYCEIDDLISNLIGTIIGCLLIALCRFLKLGGK